jgi:hypothetical protein
VISRVLIKKQPARRWMKYAAGLGVLVLTLGFAGSVLAVHELDFQLDGEVTNTPYSPPHPPATTPGYDWNDIFNVSSASGSQTVANNTANVGNGKTFAAASFVRDFESGGCDTPANLISTSATFCTHDDTTYATGSKDTLGIGNGGWQCNHDQNTNSKIDIVNAYVLSYVASNGDKIFYFGIEKNKPNGTNDIGIWFLRGGATCSAPTGHINFTGKHQDGDTLVVSEYTNGGGVSTIKAFRWAAAASGPLSGDGGCIDSHDNPNKATGGCDMLPIATGADCKKSGAGDSLCATTNATSTDPSTPAFLPWNSDVTTNWLTADGTNVGNTVKSPDFFEGGINITKAFTGAGGTVPSCFSTIVPDTRSSASPTATLFDYTLNQLGGCSATLTTTANAATTREIAANGTISSDTDTANLKIKGTDVWGGTLKFYLCGPNVTSCSTNGYLVTTKTVANTDNSNCGANCTYTSDSTTLTAAGVGAAGKYCWHAQFVPNDDTKAAGIANVDDDGTGECFSVTPKKPTLTTQASGAVALGSSISDTASLTGTARNPDPANPGSNATFPTINGGTKAAAGTITWLLYGPASDGSAQCTTAITGAPTPSSATVSGDKPTAADPTARYGPVSYATNHAGDKAGKYEFAATYGGEGPNTLAADDVGCDVTGANNEQVIVSSSSLSTSKNAAATREIGADGTITSGTDNATLQIKGASTWGGTLTWYLCGPNVTSCGTTGYVVTTQTVANTDNTNCGANCTYTSGSTTLTSAAGTGKYCWHAQFVPDAATLANGVNTADDDGTNECFTVTPKTPVLATTATCLSTPCVLGSTLNDTASLTGTARNPDPANPGTNANFPTINGGTKAADSSITWSLYGPGSGGVGQCVTAISGAPTPSSVSVSGDNTSYGPVAYTTNHAGDVVGKYTFAASYGGDGPNTLAATAVACDATGGNGEQVTVIGTASSSSKQGYLPNDRITITSTAGTTLNGSVDATLYQGAFTGTLANCGAGTATQKYTENISVTAATNTKTVFTSNTSFYIGVNPSTGDAGGSDGNYFWLIHTNLSGLSNPPDRCESFTISHNDG